MSKKRARQAKREFWTALPANLLSLVFGCLNYRCLFICYGVCRSWNKIPASWAKITVLKDEFLQNMHVCQKSQVKSATVTTHLLDQFIELRNLEHLWLIQNTHVTRERTFLDLLTQFPKLTDLDLSCVNHTILGEEYHKLEHLPCLRRVVLAWVRHRDMDWIGNMVFLRDLQIKFAHDVRDISIIMLNKLRRLETLTLLCSRTYMITATGQEAALKTLTELKRLTIKKCKVLPSFEFLAKYLTSLESLALVNNGGSLLDESLSAISKFHSLRSLTLDGIQIQPCLPVKLQYLSLSLNGKTEESHLLSYFCLTLRELWLKGEYHIWSRQLCNTLANLPVLRTLSLTECYTKTNDDGVIRSFADDGLAELARSKSLRDLTLQFCMTVTDNGIAALKASGLVNFTAQQCFGLTERAIHEVKRHLFRKSLAVVKAT